MKRSCEGTRKLSTCQPRSQRFSLLFYLLFFRDWNAVVQYHTIQCLLIFCNTYHRQPSVCFTEASRLFIVQTCQSATLIPTNHKKECERPPSCPTNIPADRTRSQFVTEDGFALCVGNMQCRLEISRATEWRTIFFVPQAEDGARKMQAMDKKLRKTARTAKLGTRKQT